MITKEAIVFYANEDALSVIVGECIHLGSQAVELVDLAFELVAAVFAASKRSWASMLAPMRLSHCHRRYSGLGCQ